jgi:hypothetical protein
MHQRMTEMERLRIEELERHQAFRDSIGADGLGLVGPGGVLDETERRALLAAAMRPPVKRPLFALLGILYRAGHRIRR